VRLTSILELSIVAVIESVAAVRALISKLVASTVCTVGIFVTSTVPSTGNTVFVTFTSLTAGSFSIETLNLSFVAS
jgi:uncharacterized membrane protein